MTPSQLRWELLNAAILPIVFLGSIPITYLVSPDWAQRSWISLAVIYPIVGTLRSRSIRRAEAAGGGTGAKGNTPA